MKTLAARIDYLLSRRAILSPCVGDYDEASLIKWLDSEIGDSRRLEQWVGTSRVIPRAPVLHILSGNTEHAAFQSVFRTVLLGCPSWVKIPSAGLPEFEKWAAELDSVELRRELPEDWRCPEVAVVYGNADTLQFFREWLSPEARIIPHGPKLSAAFIFSEREHLEHDLTNDIMRYGQRGCLSVQVVYLKSDNMKNFCKALAEQMQSFLATHGKIAQSLSEAGAIRNARELIRFRIANGAPLEIWESEGNTDWTVVLDQENTQLQAGPSGGFVRVVPMPAEISEETLGPETRFLSTAVCEPLSAADQLELLQPPRICSAGKAQEPGILWHPDGEMPLAPLLRWRDRG